MDLQVLRIEFAVETLRLFDCFFAFVPVRKNIASVNINRQFWLVFVFAYLFITASRQKT